VRFSVLALDYDGTIATDGALDPKVRHAIADVRARGIPVILVIGRILDDLRRLVGDLRFVDAVVAENGAIVTASRGALTAAARTRRTPSCSASKHATNFRKL